MADIKSMFYQVKVPPQLGFLLKYLYSKNSDLSQNVKDYQICSHKFGFA